jgi:hypothetical protein
MHEAELAELRGEGSTVLAVHVRQCSGCARRAGMLVQATDVLAGMLEADGRDAELEVHRIRAIVRRTWPGRLAAASIAAAALLLFAVGLNRLDPGGPPDAVVTDASSLQATPEVEIPTGRNAVVFRTSNPKITVVWYYPSEGGP